MMDSVTILRSECGNATKTFSVNKNQDIIKTPYSTRKYYFPRNESVSSLNDLGKLIQQQENSPKECIIFGEQIGTDKKVLRRKYGNEGGVFEDKARHWVCVDIDDCPLPDWIDPAIDPKAGVRWVRALLPRPFRKTRVFFQYSSSQNIPEKLGNPPPKIAKLHLFFWLDKTVTAKQWRSYFSQYKLVDCALYTVTQPYYIAKPIFKGMQDPMNTRSGFIDGDIDVVAVPDFQGGEK